MATIEFDLTVHAFGVYGIAAGSGGGCEGDGDEFCCLGTATESNGDLTTNGISECDFPAGSASAFLGDPATANLQNVLLPPGAVAGVNLQLLNGTVPEPGTLLLIGAGLAGLAWRRRRPS